MSAEIMSVYQCDAGVSPHFLQTAFRAPADKKRVAAIAGDMTTLRILMF